MSELGSYSLSDLMLFSPRVYYRLFELHNQALWPAQVLTIALGLAVIYLLVRPTPTGGRLILTICGALWLFMAWSFFWERYVTINWGAAYIAPFAALEGILLIGFAALGTQPDFARPCKSSDLTALGLLGFAVVGYPFIAAAMGRSWSAAEVFGVAPDPTAIATIAVLALANRGAKWPLMLIPCLWCAIAGLTLWVLEANDFFIAPVCALVAVVTAVRRVHR